MTEPDNFISTYDEKRNPIDIPYPLVKGVPMHPSEVIRIHNKGELFFRCAHGMICEAWYIGLNSANELRGCAFIRCPRQINHRCGFYVKLNDIYGPLHQAHQLKASRKMEPYPSPPQSRKRPSSLTELPNTPTKRSKKVGKQMAKNMLIPILFQPVILKGRIIYPLHSKTMDFYCLRQVMTVSNYATGRRYTSNFSSEIVSFFTDLCDATIGPKGTVIHDETKNSQGTFTETAIDIEVLIKQLRREIFKSEACVEERNQHNLQQDQRELRSLLKDIKGAGVGPNNEMISPPSSAFFATGSSIDDPIDVDYVETCADCSQEIDTALHRELCLGIFDNL
ncbi:hypothetical protein C8R41DRAFT_977655 [Lentinula lateritia]|uniref:Uncharacterized protein n=1 Tax=Lentinula lateritia TaxID=40482 RepID=A0ABQ8VVJ4_9AGAR|nr:hypothetical protein C8R41DRAFT_977655 [Lentinula lateritia]